MRTGFGDELWLVEIESRALYKEKEMYKKQAEEFRKAANDLAVELEQTNRELEQAEYWARRLAREREHYL